MIRRLLFFYILTATQIVIGQSYNCESLPDSLDGIPIHLFAETDAEFPGGEEKLNLFINENLEYISELPCYTGHVYVEFIVMPDGKIRNIKIVRGIQDLIDQSVVDIIKKMPNWVPATIENRAVAVAWILPVKIG